MLSESHIKEWLINVFANLHFNQTLGLTFTELTPERAELTLQWDDKLMGNPMHKILHGGVTASALDTVGGILAIYSRLVAQPMKDEFALAAFTKNVGTIDLRTDYLRPGRGEIFTASAQLIRAGNRVCVTRMELHNDQGEQLAFGTGTYLVG